MVVVRDHRGRRADDERRRVHAVQAVVGVVRRADEARGVGRFAVGLVVGRVPGVGAVVEHAGAVGTKTMSEDPELAC